MHEWSAFSLNQPQHPSFRSRHPQGSRSASLLGQATSTIWNSGRVSSKRPGGRGHSWQPKFPQRLQRGTAGIRTPQQGAPRNEQKWGGFSKRLHLSVNSTQASTSIFTQTPSTLASKIKGPGLLPQSLPRSQIARSLNLYFSSLSTLGGWGHGSSAFLPPASKDKRHHGLDSSLPRHTPPFCSGPQLTNKSPTQQSDVQASIDLLHKFYSVMYCSI